MAPPDSSGRAIVVHPFETQTMLYGVWHSKGVFRSEDRGNSWDFTGLENLRIEKLAIDTIHANYVYATTAEASAGVKAGLYRSNDTGNSWTPGLLNESFGQVVVDPFESSIVYAGMIYSGLKHSTDHGASWANSSWGLSAYSVTAMLVNPVNPAVLYTGLNPWGVMKSTDRGATWVLASTGLPAQANLSSLALDPADPQVLYAATYDAGVYVSRDGANSWALAGAGYPGAAALQSALQPVSSFADSNDPLHNRPLPALAQRDQDSPQAGLAAVQSSASGTALAVSPGASRAVLVGTLGKGIYRLTAASWSATSRVSGNIYDLFFDLSGQAFAGTDAASGSLLVSSDDGQTWAVSGTGLAGRVVYTIAQSPLQPALYYAGTDAGLYRSADGGATWAPAGLAGQAVTAVIADRSLANGVIAGTVSRLYVSQNQGDSWAAIEGSLENFGVQQIVVDPAETRSYYLATRFGGTVRILR
jgi:photosystem II stability/assembly factor-like uncharacterized protein